MSCLNGLLLLYGGDLKPQLPTTHKAVSSYVKHAWTVHTSVPLKVGVGAMQACVSVSTKHESLKPAMVWTWRLHSFGSQVIRSRIQAAWINATHIAEMVCCAWRCVCCAGGRAVLLPPVPGIGCHPLGGWWHISARPAQPCDE